MIQARVQKVNFSTYIYMAIMALCFGYIVLKDLELPQWLLVGGAFFAALVLFAKGLSRPHIVTYVLVAYLPFSKELVGDFGGLATAFNLTNLLMGFILIVWMTGQFAQDEPLWLPTSLNLPIFLFMIVGLVAILRNTTYGGYFTQAIIEYKRWITPMLLYFLVLNTVKDKETIKGVVYVMITVTTVVGLMALYDYFDLGTVSSMEKSRIGGISDQPNMLAAFFNYYMFLPFGFFLLRWGKLHYWSLLIPFLIQFRGIMVTFSRGGYLAFAFGLFAIIFFRSKVLFFLLLIATVFTIANPFFLPAGIRYRMGQTFHTSPSYMDDITEESLETSARTRVEVWKGGIEMIKDYPLLGVGYGLFQQRIPDYWSGHKEIDAHNTYLIVAAEMGIPALIIFLWIIWIVFWHTRLLFVTTADPFSKALALGFLGGIFGLLMSNMFGSRLNSQEVSSYFWILAALIMRLRIIDQRERGPRKPETVSMPASASF